MGEERRAEMEKIDEEVAVIMQRVRAERAMNAESAKKPEASEAPLGDARGGERGGANRRRGGKDARTDAGTDV